MTEGALELVGVSGAARILGCTRQTIYFHTRDRKLPPPFAVDQSGRMLWLRKVIEALASEAEAS